MKREKDKILQMLEEGTISAEEAQSLLDAVDDLDQSEEINSWQETTPRILSSHDNWRGPFGLFVILTAFFGSLLLRTRRAKGISALTGKIFLIPLTILSALSAGFIYISKDGPWLYLKVRSAEEEKVSISFPFPLNVLRGGMQLIRSQINDDQTGQKLDVATEFLETIEIADINNPVTIDIEEEKSNIQIYLG